MILFNAVHRQLFKVKTSCHILFSRSYSPYNGYWTLLLQQKPKINEEPLIEDRLKVPIHVPTSDINTFTTTNKQSEQPQTKFVWLNNEKIILPEKPPPPENCCMSGCINCVYDIYQEDMEFYKDQLNNIRERFQSAGKELPDILKQKKDEKVENDIDPTMRAFLEMEKKLNAS